MSAAAVTSQEPIPGYRLCERIGAGGYGEVWRCEAPGGLVKAIKLVFGWLDDDRAARELKAMQRIKGVRHPFLLSLERIEVVDGQLMIITELADGSLKDVFEKYKKQNQPGIPFDALLRDLRDAADALDYMSESHSLQHLDVKPENLLMVGDRVKVADFGLVKEIQDVTASIMGGLTPIYAPPEVFDGQPTRFSDQYSLAIVFQEMLTGVLPFPGRTAAQLAAQHLNAKPRLAALPAHFQPIIGRALSKKPEERFKSCKELMDTLANAACGGGSSVAASSAPRVSGTDATRGFDDGESAEIRTPELMFKELDQATSTASFLSDLELPPVDLAPEPSRPLQDQPPVAYDPATWKARPTLFLGVGGTGVQTLGHVRRRWNDHFANAGPGCKFLALDLAREAEDAGADAPPPLKHEELLEMPLRKAQDYKRDGGQIMNWLSRRWLFNIPRSLKTEGMRPLGRLAFTDHAARIHSELKSLLVELAAGNPDVPLRIVLVGAIGGGTAGGMLVDLCFLARQTLEELKLAGEVALVLTHCTSRNPVNQEVNAASAFATISELAHYSRVDFPGDLSCGLKPRKASEPVVDGAYFYHLGEELTKRKYAAALGGLADFIFMESATPAGGYFHACRTGDPAQPRKLTLRGAGLYRVGLTQDSLVSEIAEAICRETLDRWIGTPKAAEKSNTVGFNPGKSTPPVGAKLNADLDHAADVLAERFQMSDQQLLLQMQNLLEKEIPGGSEALFRNLIGADMNADCTGNVLEFFGGRDSHGDLPDAKQTQLRQKADERLRLFLRPLGERLRNAVEQVLEEPAARIYGAQRIVKRLQSTLRMQSDSLRDLGKHTNAEVMQLEMTLLAADPKQKQKRNPAEVQERRLEYCRQRLFDIALQITGQLIAGLQSYLTQSSDLLSDLDRELKTWQDEFTFTAEQETPQPSAEESDEEAAESQETKPLDQIRLALAGELRQRVTALASAVDQRINTDVFQTQGGLRNVLLRGGSLRQQLSQLLRQQARRGVLHLLKAIDMNRLLLEGAGDANPQKSLLGRCLKAAEPWLQSCGGSRRLLWIVPPEHAAKTSPQTLTAALAKQSFQQSPQILTNCGSDVVLMYELGDLSLQQIAGSVIDFRKDLGELGRRLHTRTDVQWQQVPVRG